MKWLWIVGVAATAASLVQCGGSTDDSSTGGSAGSAGTGGSGGSAGSGGTAGTGGAGGSAGSPDFYACAVNSDCVLRPASCCGSCGAATRGDAVAVNQKYLGDYATSVCDNGGCPACYSPQDPTLQATCNAGTCAVVDLLTHPSTECQSPADCRVRTSDCCECGGATDPEHLIAISISGDAAYSALVCDPNTACTECAPTYPPVQVVCVDGHCGIAQAGANP